MLHSAFSPTTSTCLFPVLVLWSKVHAHHEMCLLLLFRVLRQRLLRRCMYHESMDDWLINNGIPQTLITSYWGGQSVGHGFQRALQSVRGSLCCFTRMLMLVDIMCTLTHQRPSYGWNGQNSCGDWFWVNLCQSSKDNLERTFFYTKHKSHLISFYLGI